MAPTSRSFKGMMLWSAATLSRSAAAFSQIFPLDETWPNHQQCVDLYGRDALDPRSESSITVVMEPQNRAGIVSVVIFELGDEHLGGIVRPGTHEKEVLCSAETAQEGLCNESQLGEFLISDAARAAAKYPMMTRAIDVSKPIPLIYPVRTPGFYCAATFSFSVDKFTGTMRTSEPASNGPAFKRKLVDVYCYLTPLILLISTIWACFEAWNGSLGQSKLAISLVTLSALETMARWAQLGEGDKTVADLLNASWALMQVVLVAMTIVTTSTLARKHGVWLSPLVATVTTLIMASLWALWIWAEITASSTDFRPVYLDLLISCFLGFFFFGCGIAYCRRRKELKRGLRAEVAVGLCILIPGILFVAIGAANCGILTRKMDPVDFGKRYWNYRLWLVDGPFETTLPVWAVFNALMLSVEASRGKCSHEHDPWAGEMQELKEEGAIEA
ncbi:hypothetical protein INS49_006273 [Diaporthe citri]|uniref:uncharacterized protein n=1 Tax=Diaporthe citri TaxID=83186 RepID=UPI001C815909|nr:uncharacterized protein INS49_006273 [Diaporthe citri]KAG6364669.1 hypothetical protein INS49_006273 [Diaporthe citri]